MAYDETTTLDELEKHKKKHKKNKKPKTPGWLPRYPFDQQRYPHTHFEDNKPIQALWENIRILKDWCKTLTKLLGALADLHNSDIEAIIDELQKLLDKMNEWINEITEILDRYFEQELRFQNNEVYDSEQLNTLASMLNTWVISLTPIMESLLNCIEDVLIQHDKYIGDIYEEIKDIKKSIENIFEALKNLFTGGATSKITLTYGTDYTITTHNGFYFPGTYYGNSAVTHPNVVVYRQKIEIFDTTYYADEVRIVCNPGYTLQNSKKTSSSSNSTNFPTFAHSLDMGEVPTSWIFDIQFNDDNYKNLVSWDMLEDIWDFTADRSTWNVSVRVADLGSGKYRIYMNNISDGYNDQYYNNYPTGNGFYNLNMQVTLNFSYNK